MKCQRRFHERVRLYVTFTYDELRQGWKEESRGKRNLPNQQRYRYELEDRLYDLGARIDAGMFRPTKLRIKKIYFPKLRKAQVPSQEDKIVQHAVCDGYAYYAMTAPLIKEASANTRGRGTDYGRAMTKANLRRFYLKHGTPPYILKGDVHSFFYSIPHERAKALLERYIERDDIRRIMEEFVDLTGLGLPLGLQQSQLLANLYLSEFDHKVKERLGAEQYGRHMDDFYILADSREELEGILKWTEEYMAGIGLELNPKTAIYYRAFDYLGFHYVVSDSGKIIERLAKDKLKSKRRHVKKLAGQLGRGEIAAEKFESAYFGWRQHAVKAKNGRTQVLNMDRYAAAEVRKAGYELEIASAPWGKKIKWRVKMTPAGGDETKCQGPSPT